MPPDVVSRDLTAGEHLLNWLLGTAGPPLGAENFENMQWSLNMGVRLCGSVFWKMQACANRLNPSVETGLDQILAASVDFVNDVASIIDAFALKIRDGVDISNLLHAILRAVPDIRDMLASIGISEHRFKSLLLGDHDVLAHAIYALVHAARVPGTVAYTALRQIAMPSWISRADVLNTSRNFAMLSFALAQAPLPTSFETTEACTFVRELLDFVRDHDPLDGLKHVIMRANKP